MTLNAAAVARHHAQQQQCPARARDFPGRATETASRPVRARPGDPRPLSPPAGAPGVVRPRLRFDHLGRRRTPVFFEAHGPADARPTVVLGGISAGRHLAPTASDPHPGWWAGMVGHGRALDPARRRLVGIDFLGGPSGAGLLRPITTHDQARAVAAVLDELGGRRADVVGASYGGMVALAFAELFPERVSRLVVVCAAHRTHPMATALRSLQRSVVRLGACAGRDAEGLALARALAMTTYRSAREFEGRFPAAPLGQDGDGETRAAARPLARGRRAAQRFPVENYLEARGAAFARDFDPERFLALSESIDLHRTRPDSVPASTLLVSVDSDSLAPPWLVDRLAAKARGRATHATLSSRFGHDAFLKETGLVSAMVRRGLGGEGADAAGADTALARAGDGEEETEPTTPTLGGHAPDGVASKADKKTEPTTQALDRNAPDSVASEVEKEAEPTKQNEEARR